MGYLDKLNDRQRQAVEFGSEPLLVISGAGSGNPYRRDGSGWHSGLRRGHADQKAGSRFLIHGSHGRQDRLTAPRFFDDRQKLCIFNSWRSHTMMNGITNPELSIGCPHLSPQTICLTCSAKFSVLWAKTSCACSSTSSN